MAWGNDQWARRMAVALVAVLFLIPGQGLAIGAAHSRALPQSPLPAIVGSPHPVARRSGPSAWAMSSGSPGTQVLPFDRTLVNGALAGESLPQLAVDTATASLSQGEGPDSFVVRESLAPSLQASHGAGETAGPAITPVPFSGSATPTWSNITSSLVIEPRAGEQLSMAYDTADGYVVLYLPSQAQSWLRGSPTPGYTWTFSGGQWTNLTSTIGAAAPPSRDDSSMSYDSASSQVLLFGGYTAVINPSTGSYYVADMSDTWAFSAGHWTNLTSTAGTPPSGRFLAMMTFDGADNEMVLFGGDFNSISTAQHQLTDTWKFASGVWTNITATAGTAPSPRVVAGLVDDTPDGYLLLFGGLRTNLAGAVVHVCDDSWKFNGGVWTNLTGSLTLSPPAGSGAPMVYDGAISLVLEYEGPSGTWTYSAGAWTNITATAGTPPPLLNGVSATVYDAKDGYVVDWIGYRTFGPSYTWMFGTGTPPPLFVVSIATAPTTCGSITFSGVTYTNGQSVNAAYGSHSVSATACGGYALSGIAASGSVTYWPGNSTASVGGAGGLTATFLYQSPPPHYVVWFNVTPAPCSPLTFNGTSQANGSSASLLANSYQAGAGVCSGYRFDTWAAMGGVSVATPTAPASTVTVSAGGSLTAIYWSTNSTTTLSCSPVLVGIGSTTVCTAEVTGLTPSGTVSFTTAGIGSLPGSLSPSSSSCTLSLGTCYATFIGGSEGGVNVTAAYGGDLNNRPGTSGNYTLTVTSTPSAQAWSGSVSTSMTLDVSTPGYSYSSMDSWSGHFTVHLSSMYRLGYSSIAPCPAQNLCFYGTGSGVGTADLEYGSQTPAPGETCTYEGPLLNNATVWGLVVNPFLMAGGETMFPGGVAWTFYVYLPAAATATCLGSGGLDPNLGLTQELVNFAPGLVLQAGFGETFAYSEIGQTGATTVEFGAVNVHCHPASELVGGTGDCLAYVSGNYPSGEVEWSGLMLGAGGTITFGHTACILVHLAATTSVCGISLRSQVYGKVKVTAHYLGDTLNPSMTGKGWMTFAQGQSQVALACSPSVVNGTLHASCNATVSGNPPTPIPSGTVAWNELDPVGVLSNSSCTLKGAVCGDALVQANASSEPATLVATYLGDSIHPSAQAADTLSVVTDGAASADQTQATGMNISLAGVSGSVANVVTTDLVVQPTLTGTAPFPSGEYFDVQVTGVTGGNATVCYTGAEVLAQTSMDYFSNGTWIRAGSVSAVSGQSVCGAIPIASLAGDPVAIGPFDPAGVPYYTVSFEASGLPAATSWEVSFNGSGLNSTTISIQFQVPNGTTSFTIGAVSGFTASPQSGSVQIDGANRTIMITFVSGNGPHSSKGFLGLPGMEGYILVGAVVPVVAAVATLTLFRRRSGSAAQPKSESKQAEDNDAKGKVSPEKTDALVTPEKDDGAGKE